MEISWRGKLPQNSRLNGPLRFNRVRSPEDALVPWRERIKHFTWAWFGCTLSTSGIAVLLGLTPHRFPGLTTIGKIFFIFTMVLTVAFSIAICIRFYLVRTALRNSFIHPTESLFFPTFLLTLLNLLMCVQIYGVPEEGSWLIVALRVMYWIYVAVAFITAVVQYLDLFAAPAKRLTIQGMVPAWILPIYPSKLIGSLTAVIAPSQPPPHRVAMIVAGLTFTGLGWMVALLMLAAYLQRLLAYGLPAPNLRPGMFISVGPPSFVAIGLIGIADALPTDYWYLNKHPLAVYVLQPVADFTAIFIWLLGFWFFCITLLAVLAGVREMSFHLVWWATVFPNTGLTMAMIRIGNSLESPGILWTTSVMTAILVALWLFVFVAMIRAVMKRDILMPGKDEDKDQFKEDDEQWGVRAPPM